VLTLVIPVRKWYKLESLITLQHMDNMSKVMLATSLIVCYGYLSEVFFAWYSGNQYERFMMLNRMTGPYWPAYWMLLFCNFLTPQLLWFKKIRISNWPLWIITIVIGVGMWLERYVIVVTSLTRDFLPSSWGTYHGTLWDWGTYLGTLGFFTFCMGLFIRFLPMIAVHEVRVTHHKAVGKGH